MATNNMLVLSIFIIFTISPLQAALQNAGFTTNLIHRDSSLTPRDRLERAFKRSISRINLFRPTSSNGMEAEIRPDMGEYLMELSYGTPPVKQLAIADTGSDLTWLQCQPCLNCYKQTLPIFDPRKSTTYKKQSCESSACLSLGSERGICSQDNSCQYKYSYGDQSSTSGDLASDTITFASSDESTFPKVTIGCGHDNSGTFHEEGSGLVGLGGGPLSLVSQLKSSVGGKFSYCLIPFLQEGNFTSKITFGAKSEVSGRGVVSTPLVRGSTETFYYLTLEGVSVGKDTYLQYKDTSAINSAFGSNEGNIIIDSGTTLTFLPSEFYDSLSSALEKEIKGKRVDDPSGTLSLCYQSRNGGADLNIPTITAHFTGADVQLKPVNTFIQVAEETVCFGMIPADQLAIYGNIAQGNFLVGYDLEEGKLSFKPTDCTKEA